jgi:hypothetical protein
MSDAPSMFSDRPAVPVVLPDSDYIQPNLGHGLRIWWALFWRDTLISVVLSAAAGIGIQLVYMRGLLSVQTHNFVIKYVGYVITYIVAIFVMHSIVRKKFRHFRINLTSISSGEQPEVLPPTFPRTFRIWWTYTWRTVVYLVIFSFALNVPVGFITGAVAVIYPPLAKLFAQLVQLAIGAVVGLYVIYANILDEQISGFRVGLVPNNVMPPARTDVASAPAPDVRNPDGTAMPPTPPPKP